MSLATGLSAGVLAVAWMWFIGWAIARVFTASLSAPEVLGWSLACGMIFQARLYQLILLARARIGTSGFLAAGAVVVLLSIWLRRPTPSHNRARATRRGRVVIAVLAVPCLLFFLEAIAEPLWTTDYLAIWGLKAKLIFFASAIPDRLFHDPFTYWSHPEYPLFLPLLFASLSALLGRFDDQALTLLYPAFQAATVCLLFGCLRRSVSFAAGAAAAALAAFCFPLYRAVNAGSADIPVAFAMVLAATVFLDALDADPRPVRIRLLVASHACATLKQEGELFVGLLVLACFIDYLARRRRTSLIAGLGLLFPVVLHESALRLAAGRIARRDFDFTLLSPERWGDWIGRGGQVASHLARVELRAGVVAAAGLLVFLVFTRRRREDILLPVLLAQVAAYAAAASLSAFGPAWALESAFSRTTVALVPVLAIVIGARASALFEPETV